jgi:hypothetical protein
MGPIRFSGGTDTSPPTPLKEMKMPGRLKNDPARDISKAIDRVKNSDTSIGPGPNLGTEIYDRVTRNSERSDGFAAKLDKGPKNDG